MSPFPRKYHRGIQTLTLRCSKELCWWGDGCATLQQYIVQETLSWGKGLWIYPQSIYPWKMVILHSSVTVYQRVHSSWSCNASMYMYYDRDSMGLWFKIFHVQAMESWFTHTIMLRTFGALRFQPFWDKLWILLKKSQSIESSSQWTSPYTGA